MNKMENIITNEAGFVKFQSKNWGFKGDKGTFAKVTRNDDDQIIAITIKVAAKGMISSEYTKEISVFCDKLGIDFSSIPCGQSKTVEI
jgi:hypothetical protein